MLMEQDVPEPTIHIASTTRTIVSYKDSLLGYNGIANGNEIIEDDDFLNDEDDEDVPWELPEPSEEIKEMMKIYPVVPITQEEFKEWCRPWKHALILTVLGKKMNPRTLKPWLQKIWNIADFELIDLPNNYFIVRFADKDMEKVYYRKVLFEGPWVVMQHCIVIQRWTPFFDPLQNSLGRMTTWVRIPSIPMHCYNKKFIHRLGDRIGRTLRVDLNTLTEDSDNRMKTERGRYARVCVEIDLQKRLVPRLISANSWFNVEYEGLGVICFVCGRYGHRKENCPWTLKSETHSHDCHSHSPSTSSPEMRTSKITPKPENEFGPWMLVSKPNKFKGQRRGNNRSFPSEHTKSTKRSKNEESQPRASRFAAIADLDAAEQNDGIAMGSFHTEANTVLSKGKAKVSEDGQNSKALTADGTSVRSKKQGKPKGKLRYPGKENGKSATNEGPNLG